MHVLLIKAETESQSSYIEQHTGVSMQEIENTHKNVVIQMRTLHAVCPSFSNILLLISKLYYSLMLIK